MTIPRRTAASLFLCLFLALPLVHGARAAMPAPGPTPNLEALFGLYPGATITNSMSMGDMELLLLNCGQTPIDTIAAFYLPKLESKGFSITVDQALQDGRTIVADRSPYQAMVDIGIVNNETLATLTLSGLTPGEAMAVDQPAPPADASSAPAASANAPGQDAPAEQAGGQPAGAPAQESLAAQIKEYVTIPPGDTITSEFRNPDAIEVEIESQAGWQDVFQYYRLTLSKDGWQEINKFMDADGGMVTFQKEGRTLVLVTNETAPATRYSLILKQ